MQENNQIDVYVISNISPSRHTYIDSVCLKLGSRFSIFRPHTDNEYNLDNAQIEFKAFYKDKQEMDAADISLVLMPLFGRDCAAEIGYSQGIGNTVIAYVDKMETDQEKDWLTDWMVKGFLDYIITPDENAYQTLQTNPLIEQKTGHDRSQGRKRIVFKISDTGELSDLMESLLEEKKNSQRNCPH